MTSIVITKTIKEYRIDTKNVEPGDIIRLNRKQAGYWEKNFSAVVVAIKEDRMGLLVAGKTEIEYYTIQELLNVKAEVIYRPRVEDARISKGQIYYKDLSEEEKEALSDGTKNAISSREEERKEAAIRNEQASYKADTFASKYSTRSKGITPKFDGGN